MRITLDAETFKALASATRLAVLRALGERRKTLSELARDLELNKATVHEHLQVLSAAELVKKRDDEGRKWIYYELTWRGQKILHPQETTTFSVLLGLSVLAAGGGAAMLARALWLASSQVGSLGEPEGWDLLKAGSDSPAAEPAAAGSTGTQAAASTAASAPSSSPASGTATASSAPPPASPAAGTAADAQGSDRMALDAGAGATDPAAAPLDDGSWFEHGGALALVILAASLLFALLATALRLRLGPKLGEEPGLE